METNPPHQPPPPPVAQAVPASSMNMECPYCKATLRMEPSQAGSAVTCSQCGGKFQVPLPTAVASVGASGSPLRPEVKAFAEKKIAAGICGILLGCFGIHKFILGFTAAGVIMLVVSIVGCVFLGPTVMSIIGIIEGIIYLTKSDEEFYQTYAVEKKAWF